MGKYGKIFLICIIVLIISVTIQVATGSYLPMFFSIISGGISAAILYFIPTIVAAERNHRNEGAIGLLNFFVGWTFIGWVICLVWAVTNEKEEPNVTTNTVNSNNNSKYDDLKKLQELKDNGTITDEEFEKEKAKILNK